MKFNETLIYRVLSIPGIEWDKSCGYVFALKIPVLLLMILIGVPFAIVLDFLCATSKVDGVA